MKWFTNKPPRQMVEETAHFNLTEDRQWQQEYWEKVVRPRREGFYHLEFDATQFMLETNAAELQGGGSGARHRPDHQVFHRLPHDDGRDASFLGNDWFWASLAHRYRVSW